MVRMSLGTIPKSIQTILNLFQKKLSYLAAKVIFIQIMSAEKNQINFRSDKLGDDASFFKITFLGMTIFLSLMIGLGIIEALGAWKGIGSQEALRSLNNESPANLRNFIRVNLMINHLTMFIIPTIVFSYFFYKSKWINYLSIDKFPNIINLFLGVIIILAAFPLAQFALWLNMKVPLPASLIETETQLAEMIGNLLIVTEPYELWFNIFIIAVIPAIGEEFLFRGIIQKKLVEKLQNPHLGIWIAAVIFSAFHMQFQGFLPRVVLGAILGYLFVWSGNLWVPIIAHFANNAFQIVGQYFYQKEKIGFDFDEMMVDVNWGMAIASLIIIVMLGRLMIFLNRNQKKDYGL